MRWISFAIVLYVVTVLQTAAAPYLALHTVWPNFLVILAVYYALEAKPDDAMRACWIIGLVIDLAGLSYANHNYSNVGLCALTLGLVGAAIVKVRDLTFRESAWSQLVFCFIAQAILSCAVGLHMSYALGSWGRFTDVLSHGLYGAAYTAAVAPYGHWLLRRFRGALGVGSAAGFGASYRRGLR